MLEEKEVEVRSMGPSSSDYTTIVPIKKRRFPIIPPPSPPPEESCPVLKPTENQQESNSVSQGSTILNLAPEEVKPEGSAISPKAGACSGVQRNKDASANQGKLEPLSVNLALTNGESSFDSSIGTMKSDKDVTDLCTNRSNWDLNTTMDAWEASTGDAMSINTDHLHGTNTASGDRVDNKPLGSPSEIPGAHMLGEQTAAEHQHGEVSAAPPAPSASAHTQEDSLKLGLQLPFPSNFNREHLYLSPGIGRLSKIFSMVSSVGSSSIALPMAVKLEPYVEAQKQACQGTGSSNLKSLVEKSVKRETVDKAGLEISHSTLKLSVSRSVSVKAEPRYEETPVALRTIEESSKRLEQISPGMLIESCGKVPEASSLNCPLGIESQTISNRLHESSPDREDNVYEDGEVQDQLVADGPAELMEAAPLETVNKVEGEPENLEFAGSHSNQIADSPLQKNEDAERQLCSGIEEAPLDEKSQSSVALDRHLQDLSDMDVDSDTIDPETVAQGTILPLADENTVVHPDIARISGEATVSNPELPGTSVQDDNAVKAENNGSIDDAEKNASILPKTESSVNSDVLGKDSITESNRRRIINLSATFNTSSPGKTSSSDRSMPLHEGRKRLPDVALEGDKLHLRGRNDFGNADFNRFSRERGRDSFSRNSRSGFERDRGRVPGSMCDDWGTEQDFGSEMHNGPAEFRATRYRYNSDYRNYNVSPEDGFVGTGRGGRKLLTHSPNFRSSNTIRRGFRGRDGPTTRGPPAMGRVRRDMSPGMDDSELIGVRHGFVRRERNIGSFGGKGMHRAHSKSPERLRSRSPVQWSSPRRRSPDGFSRRPEMAPRRSPPIYRRDRMGSPDRSCFRGDAMRRQNSPPYISRQLDDIREMNSGRDHGFSRSIMHNGNSSTRVPLRTRRYDMLNSRERARGEYFRVPMRGARFNELSGDEQTEERRRLNERQRPVRHFRPAYGSDDKGFTYSSDDGSRSYRICPDDDSVYHERGNSREIQLERHTKNEPGGAHKTRTIEDQEGSFRQGVSNEFDDMPRYKRERF